MVAICEYYSPTSDAHEEVDYLPVLIEELELPQLFRHVEASTANWIKQNDIEKLNRSSANIKSRIGNLKM